MMLSSADLPGDAARCRRLGVAAYLAKPLKQSEILDTILKVLGTSACDESRATQHVQAPRSLCTPSGLRILVAEDNAVNQRLVARTLEKRGHAVVVVGNGREAVETLVTSSFGVVLMDVQMPDIDGVEATGAIREMEKVNGHYVPIIAMTAHAMKGDEERCLAAGLDAYIPKPIDLNGLLTLIGQLVPRRAAVEPPAAALHA